MRRISPGRAGPHASGDGHLTPAVRNTGVLPRNLADGTGTRTDACQMHFGERAEAVLPAGEMWSRPQHIRWIRRQHHYSSARTMMQSAGVKVIWADLSGFMTIP